MQEFLILGPLEVRSEEGPIGLGGRRQRALLAALLLRAGRVVPTEQLVDELYGADPPPNATASLQNAVVALRKALGPDVIVTRPPGYVLAVTAEQIDVRRFERLLADARARGAEERRGILLDALELWRGPALAEFAFEDWAQAEARRLDELRLVAGDERLAADVELGRTPTSSRSSSRSSASTRCASGPASSSCSRSTPRVAMPTRSAPTTPTGRRSTSSASSRARRSDASRPRSSATRPG